MGFDDGQCVTDGQLAPVHSRPEPAVADLAVAAAP